MPRGNEVTRWLDGAPVDDTEGSVGDRVPYGTPDVNESETRLKEGISSFGEMTTNSFGAGFESLVNVDALLTGRRMAS